LRVKHTVWWWKKNNSNAGGELSHRGIASDWSVQLAVTNGSQYFSVTNF
jgi:hypothetical protein